jgi:dipeptidyl aminopeptidase/acylaminoacyl peptidase
MRSSKTILLWGSLFLAHHTCASVPESLLSTPLARQFGLQPTIGDPMLSPDGQRLLFMQQDRQGTSILLSLNLANGEINQVLQGTEQGYAIHWCEFANETRVLCDLRQGLFEENPNHQQMVAVDVDGTDLLAIRQLNVSREVNGIQESTDCRGYDHLRNTPLIDRVSEDPDGVLLMCEGKFLRVDLQTSNLSDSYGAGEVGSRTRASAICRRVSGWPGCWIAGTIPASPGTLGRRQRLVSNGHGFAGIFRGTQDELDRWYVRDSTDDAWRELARTDPVAFETPFQPVGYGLSLDHVFHLDWNAHTETWALYRKALSGRFESELVFAHEAVDVQLVDTMGRHQRVVAAAFLDGRPRRAIIDPRVAEVYQVISAQLPGVDVEVIDESWDQSRYLVRVRVPNRAGEFLLVDMKTESVDPIGPEYDHLADVALAETTLVQFEASTGGTITAHLTLPRNAGGPVPALIMPRSSPTHEDIAEPHYLVQFLAASGYAVFRVQNRVGTEYGLGWLRERAIGGWKQSVDDVRDSASYLIENGLAEAGSICSIGKDYGAYVALMAAIENPGSVSCVASIAGVADPRETPGGELLSVGNASENLYEGSPLRRAEELEVPVLLFHGRFDTDFGLIDHMAVFERALERQDKDVVAIEYPYVGHEIKRAPARIDMLARVRGFLAEQIGPALAEEESVSAGWRP